MLTRLVISKTAFVRYSRGKQDETRDVMNETIGKYERTGELMRSPVLSYLFDL